MRLGHVNGRFRGVFAGVLTGRTDRKILNHLLGGDLVLQWNEDNHVMMTGGAVEVFTGEWPDH